jgi:hypothetical protein
MERKRLKVTELTVKPVIVCGNDRNSIKPGVSSATQKKMQRIQHAQIMAAAKSPKVPLG